MKSIKIFGLAAVAALMAMVFIGSSSAMAESTALCKEDAVSLSKEECPEAKRISHVHEVSVGKGVLLSSLVTIECEVLFLGDVTSKNSLGAPLEILGNFTYPMTGCKTTGGTLCEVAEKSKHAIVKVLKVEHELAYAMYEFEMNFECGVFINCTYNGIGLIGHTLGPLLAGSANGETRIEDQFISKTSGALCPKTARLDLLTTPLEAIYITKGAESTESAEPTRTLCKEDAVECPEAKQISHVHEVSVGKGVLLSSLVTIECEVLFLGNVTSKNSLGNPLIILGNFSYTNCETSEKTTCYVIEVGKDAVIEVLKTAHELAEVKGSAEVNVNCGASFNCIYNGVGLVGHGLGPLLSSSLNGNVVNLEKTTNKTGGGLCPKTAKLDLTTTPLEHTYITE